MLWPNAMTTRVSIVIRMKFDESPVTDHTWAANLQYRTWDCASIAIRCFEQSHYGSLDVWINGWTDELMDWWMDGWMDGWIDWLTVICFDGWDVDRVMNRWIKWAHKNSVLSWLEDYCGDDYDFWILPYLLMRNVLLWRIFFNLSSS